GLAVVQDARIGDVEESLGRRDGVPGVRNRTLGRGMDGVDEGRRIDRPATAAPALVRVVAPRAGGGVVALTGVERVLGEGAELLVAGVAALVLDDRPPA